MPMSPNDTIVTANEAPITDALNNTWTLDNGKVAVNGIDDPTTANVIELAYVNGQIWQENTSYLWWAKSSPGDTWSPAYGTSLSPLPASTYPVSADDTVATGLGSATAAQIITDASHNTWSISRGGQVVTNGAADPTTANVIELAYEHGQIWQENTAGLWWAKSQPSDTWSPANGTSTSPVPAGAPPTVAPVPTRLWLGGGDNAASDPNDWSPTGVPQSGDALQITSAATINVAGNDLAGDTLSINATPPTYPSAPVTINTSANAQLNLALELGTSTNLNVSDTITLNLETIHGDLNASGGTIQFIGGSQISASTVHFNDNLTGTATVGLIGAQGEGTFAEINGWVGQGLTFDVGGVASLQIDHPDQFGGGLDFTGATPLNSVLFKGLTATSGDLQNGVMSLFNGNQLVDTTRVTGSTSNLVLDQTSTGAALSEGYLGGFGGGSPTPIPFTHVS